MKVATIGFFDGVHLGHQHLIHQVVTEAKQQEGTSCVVTFTIHPRTIVSNEAIELLTTTDEKHTLLKNAGIEQIVDIDFNPETMQMSAHDFMQTILKAQIGVGTLIIGYDHRFGHGRTEDLNDYVRYGQQLGIKVIQAKAYKANRQPVSSSLIRELLKEKGDIATANQLLGHTYTLSGIVEKGYGRGHTLGFPTANIAVEKNKLIPHDGVYSIRAHTPFGTFDGMLNIGLNPTYSNTARTIEAHLFDFSHSLYGQEIQIELNRHIRNEIQFDTTNDLMRQIQADEAEIRNGWTKQHAE